MKPAFLHKIFNQMMVTRKMLMYRNRNIKLLLSRYIISRYQRYYSSKVVLLTFKILNIMLNTSVVFRYFIQIMFTNLKMNI